MSKNASERAKPAGAAVLDPEVTDAIATALLEEIADKGYLGMSMDGLARRAGVGKGAIYRRWPSKEHMTVEVLKQVSHTEVELPDRGSFREDLRQAITDVRGWLSEGRMGSIFPDILAEGMRSEAMAGLLTEGIAGPRRRRGMAVLDRAVARGELSPDADRELLLDLMGALVFWRLIARRTPVTEDHIDAIVDVVLAEAQRPTA
ncbi:MAG TPA: TetR/AcrR family transcriptional regulator [Euzebya sp.]|nr:TetR/AcrR family transcriptional regulator [Euzebya sp.]